MDIAVGAGVLEYGTEHRVRFEFGLGITDDDLYCERFGTGMDHRYGLGMTMMVDEKPVRFRLGDALGHGHGLCGGRCLVQ